MIKKKVKKDYFFLQFIFFYVKIAPEPRKKRLQRILFPVPFWGHSSVGRANDF